MSEKNNSGENEWLKCLVVDDHAMMRKIIVSALRTLGIRQVGTASDGKEALKLLESHIKGDAADPYHIVFLDWGMPNVNGFELLSHCRSYKEYDKTAFIMITAETERTNVMKAIRAGATSYIQKPFTEQELNKKVQTVIKWLKTKNEKS
jgi:two-component system chemotaxis response regulator CheY